MAPVYDGLVFPLYVYGPYPLYVFLVWILQLELCNLCLFAESCCHLSLGLLIDVSQQLPTPQLLSLWSSMHGWNFCCPAICLGISQRAKRGCQMGLALNFYGPLLQPFHFIYLNWTPFCEWYSTGAIIVTRLLDVPPFIATIMIILPSLI